MSRPTRRPESASPPRRGENDTKWTVMVFMGAAVRAGEVNLTLAAVDDAAEIEAVGSGPGLNIFVQIHGGEGVSRRSHVGVSPMVEVPSDQRDAAGGVALGAFLRWSLTTAEHDPRRPNHYSMLVLWGNPAPAIGRADDRTFAGGPISLAELSTVLRRSLDEFGGSGQPKLDIIAFDGLDAATVEMAYELGPLAAYLIASQRGIPLPIWPYGQILDQLRRSSDRPMRPVELGSFVVREVCGRYASSDPVSLSLLHLERAPELFAHVEQLARKLVIALDDGRDPDHIEDAFSRAQIVEGTPYVDITEFCHYLAHGSGDALVVEAARTLGDFLVGAPPPLVRWSNQRTERPSIVTGRPFIVEQDRNAVQMARLNGISIYAPHLEPVMDDASAQVLYTQCRFSRESLWSDLVFALAGSPTTDSIAETASAAAPEVNRRERIFVCYAHEDAKWMKKLRIHLTPLENTARLDVFVDTDIQSGTVWRSRITAALNSATSAVIFVSADFLASSFIREVELPRLLQRAAEERAHEGQFRVFWLPVSAVSDSLFQESGLSHFQAVIDPKDALVRISKGKQQEAFAKLAEQIVRVFARAEET
jgi:Clostripain family/TIR domain